MDLQRTNPCKTKALEYLSHQISVIPVGQNKIPLIPWKEFQTRLATPEEIENWWQQWPDANVGIVTGQISGLLVVDVEKGGDTSKLPITAIVKTGGGGWHFYYKYVEGWQNKTKILPLTDIRGDGGYVVTTPSIHSSGQKYELIEKRPLADFPVYLFGIPKPATKWEEIVKGIPEGERNENGAKLIGKLLRTFKPDEWEMTAWPLIRNWNQSNSPPLDERELKNIYTSIARRELSQQRVFKEEKEIKFIPWDEVLKIGVDELDATKSEDIISFGYDWLDEKMVGIFKGELIVIGGETGLGKTSFATNIIYKASKKYKCGVFALEDRLADYSIKALYFEIGRLRRMDGRQNYPWNPFRKNELTDGEYKRYRNQAIENLKNGNIFFADVPVQMDVELLEKAVEEKVLENYQLFLIDHLHYFDLLKGRHSKADYIESVMIRIRDLQRRTGARILMVVHYKKLDGKKPTLDSFKDSISIVQNANYVINLWRDRSEYIKDEERFKTVFYISKVRNPNGEGKIETRYDLGINDFLKISEWTGGIPQEVEFVQPIEEIKF